MVKNHRLMLSVTAQCHNNGKPSIYIMSQHSQRLGRWVHGSAFLPLNACRDENEGTGGNSSTVVVISSDDEESELIDLIMLERYYQ